MKVEKGAATTDEFQADTELQHHHTESLADSCEHPVLYNGHCRYSSEQATVSPFTGETLTSHRWDLVWATTLRSQREAATERDERTTRKSPFSWSCVSFLLRALLIHSNFTLRNCSDHNTCSPFRYAFHISKQQGCMYTQVNCI